MIRAVSAVADRRADPFSEGAFLCAGQITPALKLNGTKLDTRVHQIAFGNTRTLSSTLVNEFRFGCNYFFNTFGRELANVRDVTSELKIPGRNFRLMRTRTLQFRHEAFNVLNTPIWNDPSTTLTSPLYGTITSTRKPMRELQLGLKFVY
jgi:hypothetical protein